MIAEVVASSALLLAAVWVSGSCLVRDHGAAARLVAGGMFVIGVAWLAMVQGLLGVGVLGMRWAVIGVILVLLAAAIGVRRPSLRVPRPDWITAGVALACVGLDVAPALRVPVDRLGPSHADAEWHRGWVEQLLGGIASPGGIYAHEPNSYPWLYHALVAGVAQSLPGGISAAFATVQVFGVAAGVLGMWLLARRMGASVAAARWSAVLFGLGAGVGWVWQHAPAGLIALKYGLGQYHGDFVLSNPPVPGLSGLPPLIPRELALYLTPIALWLLLAALDRPTRRTMCVAGALMGWLFLTGPVTALFLGAWALALALLERCTRIWILFAAALAVALVWLVPLAVSYSRYGGFAEITHQPVINPTLSEAFVGLGLLTVTGAGGLLLVASRRTSLDRRRTAVLVALPLALCVVAAAIPANAAPLGSPAVLRWLRYVPYVALALIIPAGCAMEYAVAAAGRLARPLAVALAASLTLAATVSTGLAAVWIARTPYPFHLTCSRLPLSAHDQFAVIARSYSGDFLSLAVFADTGASSYWVTDKRVKVRYRDWLATHRSQLSRQRAVQAYEQGSAPPPPGVSWLFISRRMSIDRSAFDRVARCGYHGHRFGLFRVPGSR